MNKFLFYKAVFFATASILLPLSSHASLTEPIEIGSRLELFVDHYLIQDLKGAELELGKPVREEVSLEFDLPWEIPFSGATTVIKDGDLYRLYYRGGNVDDRGEYDAASEVTCYAESRDGIHWTRPILGLHEYKGSKGNNIILPPNNPLRISHNFAPFIDKRPGVPAEERYKAVGGTKGKGLFRLVSADGIHWRMFSEEPIFYGYALDTLNVAQWSPAEEKYVAYIRPGGTEYRTIARSVSKDFVTWSEPKIVDYGDTPDEHIYTNGTHPYFRAPHIQIALPFRYQPERQVLSRSEHREFGTHYTQRQGLSDAVLMTSRGGANYDRTFLQSFIRPGLEKEAWTARSNLPSLGVVQTGPAEMSTYLTVGHTTVNYHMRRYSMRLDGFATVNAPFEGGELVTKPIIFSGKELIINYSTSSIGHVMVEILGEDGNPIPGYSLKENELIVGDEISRAVIWNGSSDVSALAGKPVQLRFHLKDADLYSMQFQK